VIVKKVEITAETLPTKCNYCSSQVIVTLSCFYDPSLTVGVVKDGVVQEEDQTLVVATVVVSHDNLRVLRLKKSEQE